MSAVIVHGTTFFSPTLRSLNDCTAFEAIKIISQLPPSRIPPFDRNFCNFTNTMPQLPVTWFPLALLLLVTLLAIHTYRSYIRLSHIPGPLPAAITNLQRLYWVYTRRAHETHIQLHSKYGALVRCGPNMVSVGSALEIDKIYKMRDPLLKVT